MKTCKNTSSTIELDFPEVSLHQLESLTDFLAEVLVVERLQELDQIDQYKRYSSVKRQRITGGG